jgi:hypothetical protein
MSRRRNFYVYAIKVDGVVRYIGKGSNGRVHVHMSAVRALVRKTRKHVRGIHRKLHHAHTGGAKIAHKFVKSGLTECQVYAAEARVIANYRKYRPGQLWNLTDGGSGYPILTPEQHANECQKIGTIAIPRCAQHIGQISSRFFALVQSGRQTTKPPCNGSSATRMYKRASARRSSEPQQQSLKC